MPFINSFFPGSTTETTVTMPSTAFSFSMGMSGSFTKIPSFGRSASGFQAVEVSSPSAKSKSLSFSVMPTETQSSNRIVVLLVGAYLNGKGTINSVSYGGQAFTRAIATVSTNDKGSAEIWYGVVPTNPDSNLVTITASENIVRVRICREILLGMTSSVPYDTDVSKKGSEDFANISLIHPANGVTLSTCIIWKDGLDGVSATWTNVTESDQTTGSSGERVAFSSAYYESSLSSARGIDCTWLGILDANVEVAGASWR